MVGIYGQVIKSLSLSRRKRFNSDKVSVIHFCPGKGRFLRTKVYVFEPGPPDPEFYPWPIFLLGEALEEIRVKHRWEAIDAENERIKLDKSQKRQYVPRTYENGETRRQLLARSKHLLLMHNSKWTEVQRMRADVLFRLYPDIEEC